jgi:hypothetical protein
VLKELTAFDFRGYPCPVIAYALQIFIVGPHDDTKLPVVHNVTHTTRHTRTSCCCHSAKERAAEKAADAAMGPEKSELVVKVISIEIHDVCAG